MLSTFLSFLPDLGLVVVKIAVAAPLYPLSSNFCSEHYRSLINNK